MLKKLRDIRKKLAKVRAAKAKIAAAKTSISQAKAELGRVKEAGLNARTKIAKVRRTVKGVKTGALIAVCAAVAGAVAGKDVFRRLGFFGLGLLPRLEAQVVGCGSSGDGACGASKEAAPG